MKADVCSKTRNGSTGTIAPKANRPKDDAAADLGDPPGSDGSMPSSSRASMSTASPGLAVSRPARRRAARSSNPLAGKTDGKILPLDVRDPSRDGLLVADLALRHLAGAADRKRSEEQTPEIQ